MTQKLSHPGDGGVCMECLEAQAGASSQLRIRLGLTSHILSFHILPIFPGAFLHHPGFNLSLQGDKVRPVPKVVPVNGIKNFLPFPEVSKAIYMTLNCNSAKALAFSRVTTSGAAVLISIFCCPLCIIQHTLKIGYNHRLVSNNPGIMPRSK